MKLNLPPPFEELVRRHDREILRFLLRISGDREDALELFQETWLRAYRAYPEVAGDQNLRAWLFTIAANLHRNHLRGQSRRKRWITQEATRPGAQPTTNGAQSDPGVTMAYLRSSLGKLPHKQREALVMRKFGGLDYDEIGAALNCSPQSARANVSQAIRKLKEQWPW